MRTLMRSAPLRYLSLILGLWLGVFLLTRSLLLVTHLSEAGSDASSLLRLYGIGLLYDLGFLAYAAVPLAALLLLCPSRIWRRGGWRTTLGVLLGASLFVMLFVAVAEWLFWDEFGVRFNFIAVDYLVYSDEVLHNLWAVSYTHLTLPTIYSV